MNQGSTISGVAPKKKAETWYARFAAVAGCRAPARLFTLTFKAPKISVWTKQTGKDRGSFMNRFVLPLIAAVAISACEGSTGKDNPFQEDPEDTEEQAEASTINEALASNVSNVSKPGADTITVEIFALDGTPLTNSFTRNAALDTAGYMAYTAQEDPLDRMFIALAAESLDGSVHAGVAIDGGQFNYFHGGGYYQRDGGFNAPSIGNGPGEAQVSYAGNYAAVTNISSSEGADLLPIPPGVDPDDLPDLPGQPSRIEGTIFLNANFADNAVNGEIYNRVLISPIDNTTTLVLDDLTLVVSDIDENGEFFGDVEMSGEVGSDVGDYGGIFGGNGATSVAGIVSVSDHIDDVENEQEYGVFVLTQCGQPNDAAVCDIVAPN